MQVSTVSEYVQRGGGLDHTHFHVDTTRSDEDEYVTDDLNKAVEALASFAQLVTRSCSFVVWTNDMHVHVKHADDLPDYGRIIVCDDPACECSALDADSYLSATDPLDEILSADERASLMRNGGGL